MILRLIIAIALTASVANAQQIMPAELIEAYKRVIPKTDDPLAREIFDSGDTIWYDHKHLHPRTQRGKFQGRAFGGIPGVNSVYSNPGPNNQSQANREYPWDLTLGGGSHDANNLKTVKAFKLPRDGAGNLKPVAVFGSDPMRWCFPTNTIFVEVAWLVHGGLWYPVECRLREREPDDWRTSRLLPYESRDDLMYKVAETHPEIAELIPSQPQERVRIVSKHPRKPINSTAVVQALPEFPTKLTARILRSKFVAVEGVPYDAVVDGPTTQSDFHIRPRGDLTANHGTGSREQCRQCHNTIGMHARDFDRQREWYLSVRGSDGIMSWNPWGQMGMQSGNPNNLRQSWVRAGIVARFEPNVHTQEHYSRSKFLDAEMRR